MTELAQIRKPKKKLHPTLSKILDQLAGEDCIKVAEELYNIDADEITDDELANICNIKLNVVRKMLYVLNEHKLSEFKKVRDKRSGWFIYYWHHTFDNLSSFIKKKQEIVMEKLLQRLEYEEKNQFFKCENHSYNHNEESNNKSCIFKTTFNVAMDLNFKCPQCGGSLNYDDNSAIKDFLKEKVAIIRQNIKNLS
ncbi:MAG: hypothetical protein ACTSRZ_11340 [Promethearchaeota archaeon]